MTFLDTTPPAMTAQRAPARIPLSDGRLRAAKAAYTTRHVELERASQLLRGVRPEVGDLVLARVTEIGQHQRIELAHGRRAALFPGDEIVVAYGNRYAPDQFEARIPNHLGPCELVAAGGVASTVLASHVRMDEATKIEPLGLLADAGGRRVSLRDGALTAAGTPIGPRPLTLAVVGSTMNSGKTTSAAGVVRGLRNAGVSVGAAKVTGTGAGGDVWLMTDAGAFPVYDFTATGYPSTYLVGHDAVRRVFVELTDQLAADGCDAIVLEIADGLFQSETAALVEDPLFAERVDAVLFASQDALGAHAGTEWLTRRGLAPLAVSGLVTASPLASREAAAATGLPVWDLERLHDPIAAMDLLARLRAARS